MLLPEPTKRPTASQYLRCAFLRKQTVKDLSALEVSESTQTLTVLIQHKPPKVLIQHKPSEMPAKTYQHVAQQVLPRLLTLFVCLRRKVKAVHGIERGSANSSVLPCAVGNLLLLPRSSLCLFLLGDAGALVLDKVNLGWYCCGGKVKNFDCCLITAVVGLGEGGCTCQDVPDYGLVKACPSIARRDSCWICLPWCEGLTSTVENLGIDGAPETP